MTHSPNLTGRSGPMFPCATSVELMPAIKDFPESLKVAIVHYWLVGHGGGEMVVAAIKEIFPQAEIFTLVADFSYARKLLGNSKISTSFLQHIPFSRRIYRSLLVLMPIALENFDLSGYDLVISSESGPAKGVLPPLNAVHICYCHSPMRYIWDHYFVYRRTSSMVVRIVMSLLIPWLRLWDQSTSLRVDEFVANSHHVRQRIAKYYRRTATVIHPPVNVDQFACAEHSGQGGYYLLAGRHVAYKQIDLAIAACERLGRQLVITGTGPETKRLKQLAGPNTIFVGQVSFENLKHHYAACRAFLMPGEEDFGITPVEAMASGRPTIAVATGGALDTVVDGTTGILYTDNSINGLAAAIQRFESVEATFDPQTIRTHAQTFSNTRFKERFRAFVLLAYNEAQARRPAMFVES